MSRSRYSTWACGASKPVSSIDLTIRIASGSVFVGHRAERPLEQVDAHLLAELVAPQVVLRRVVVIGRDHRREVEVAQQVELPGGVAEELLVHVELVVRATVVIGDERFDLGDEFVASGVERVEVAEAGSAAGGDDHALEAVGHDGADVVAQDVAGLGGDHLGGFEHLGGGGVLLLE